MKVGIALVTLGGPRNLEEVTLFLKKLTGIELPDKIISAIKERYKLIGGYSPLPEITEKQAHALEKLLTSDYKCLPAFRYCNPSIDEIITYFVEKGFEKIIFLLLSPYFTSVTTGNYINFIEKFIKENNIQTPYTFIHSWYRNKAFIDCWTNKIKKEVKNWNSFFIYSAHSIPERLSNEPYKAQILECCSLVSTNLNLKNWTLGWQSIPSNRRESWITPEVEQIMEEVKAKGYNSIVQIPIGFTADHIETLYDIDIIHANYAKNLGLSYHRITSLNDDPDFIKSLFYIIMERMGKWHD